MHLGLLIEYAWNIIQSFQLICIQLRFMSIDFISFVPICVCIGKTNDHSTMLVKLSDNKTVIR